MDKVKILNMVKEASVVSKKNFNGKDGNVSGTLYTFDEKHWDFLGEIMKETIMANPMHANEFKFNT